MKQELALRLYNYFETKADLTPQEQQFKIELGVAKEYFPITSVHRDDVYIHSGLEAVDLSDDDMTIIARQMHDAYIYSGYWESLETSCEIFKQSKL